MRFKPGLESLEARDCPAAGVVASLSAGVLTVTGTNQADQIFVGANAAGQVQLNGQLIAGGTVTLNNVSVIVISAFGGNDNITLDASLNTLVNGVLARSPDSQVLAGAGDDTITINNGGIVGGLAGVASGVVIGPVAGNNYTEGGSGNDFWLSGFGNDTFLGGAGNDKGIWRPGTLTDRMDGGAGYDTYTVIGNTGVGDTFTLNNVNGLLVFQRTNLVNFTVNMSGVEQVNLDPGAGGGDVVTIGDLRGTGVKQVNVFVDDPLDQVFIAPQRRGIDVDVLSISF